MRRTIPLIGGICFIVGLVLFTKGFFLTRFEIQTFSRCEERPNGEIAKIFDDVEIERGDSDCWMRRRYEKAVIILVDGLRYDFVASSLTETTSSHYYEHRMPVFKKLLNEYPERSVLYRFVADPPTVTMQRLKGLLTGGLPTFIDIRKNFAGTELSEDNLVSQLVRSRRRVVFMGDDTWTKLFPNTFTREYPFPSFDVKDLDTVDLGVAKHLIPEMRKDDFDFLVAHTLGVDHVGHRYGPEHPEMKAKLSRTNDLIEDAIEALDENTLLLVFGDHGMTEDGNHGGASPEETGSALFMYSKTKRLHDSTTLHQGERRAVSQVDLVPTLALLLGIPIPFGSLGSVLPDLMYGDDDDQREETLTRALDLNVAQVWTYLKTYSSFKGTFSARAMDHLANVLTIRDENDSKIERDLRFLRSALDMCRQQWTAFDWTSIALGLAIMFLSACVMMMYSSSRTFSSTNSSVKTTRTMNILSSIVLMSQCISFTSNSYVNAGAQTTGFFLATMLCLIGVEMSRRRRGVQFEILLILGLIRLSSEYVSYRRNVGGPLGCSEPVSMLHSVCPVVIMWLVFVLSCKQQHIDKFHIVISAISFMIVCVFWFKDSFQGQDEDSVLPRLVFFLSIIGLVVRRSGVVNSDVIKLKLLCMIPIVLLSMGPRSSFSILLLTCTGLRFLRLVERDTAISPFACALFWCLLGYHGFFTTGHTAEFASLQHSCGFVGMKGFDPVISPFWVLVNTISAPCGMAISTPLLSDALKVDITYRIGFFSACMAFSAAFTAALHSRHLMVWAIFAPKFVAESCLSVCVFAALSLGRLLYIYN